MLSFPNLEHARIIRDGSDDVVIRMTGCPHCRGNGWLKKNPFASYNQDFVQCPTCETAKAYFDVHGVLPDDVLQAMSSTAAVG